MKYNSPYEIGVGDVVIMTDKTGYKTEHLVLINYIKNETDAKGYTPPSNRTILIDNLSLMGMDYVNGRLSRSGMDCYDEVMQTLNVLKDGEHWCNKAYNGLW